MNEGCLHCGLEVKGKGDFCCPGCKVAYSIINNLGLSSYYQSRVLKKGKRVLKPENGDPVDVSEFILEESGVKTLNLMVEGLHCAACIWLIESILKRNDSVKKARINMSSHKLILQWAGEYQEGNRLVKLINDLGYKLTPFDFEILKSEEKEYGSKLLKSMAVAGFAAGNVMLISVSLWSSSSQEMGVSTRNLLHLVSALIAVPAIIYSGRIFFSSAFKALKSRTTNMDVPISVAIILVCLTSLIETFSNAEHIYFDSAIMLTFFLLIGRYLDFSIRKKALDISGDLLLLSASTATIIDGKKSKIVAVKNLKVGMIISVASGEKIAADGIILEGEGEIDTSVITGESLPTLVKKDDEVFAGMVNLTNSIKVQVTKSKDDTLLAKIVQLVTDLELKKGRYVKIADQVSRYYTPVVHLLAVATFTGWFFGMGVDWKISLSNAIAVLIITCPCALALAVPVVQVLASSKLMKQRILLKSGQALERLDGVKIVVFDKTGTLTLGRPALVSASVKVDDLLFKLAASIAAKSSHPLSKALACSYKGDIVDLQIKEFPGEGLMATYRGKEVRLGKRGFLEESICTHSNSNNSEIHMSYGAQTASFYFSDALRKDAKLVIEKLKEMGKRVILLSGDKKGVVEDVARNLEIDEYYYAQNPVQKCSFLKESKNKYSSVLMVGDGINDAPALAAADVSISPSSASDITKNTADLIFQGEELFAIITAIKVAEKSKSLMKQNFLLALTYNLIAIPFAMGGYIVPLIAALSMSASSIIVILNSLRIRG